MGPPSDGRDDSEDSDDEQESVDALGDTVNDVETAVAALLLLLADFVLSCKVAAFFRRAPWRLWTSSEGDEDGWVLLLLVVGTIGSGISLETVRERVRKATGEGVELCCLPLSLVLRSGSPCLRFLLLLLCLLLLW